MVQIAAKATSKLPPQPTVAKIFYADDEGGLHRNDPTQRPLWETETADSKTAAAGPDN